MANYDSDSSGGEDIETNVLLGYASKTSTGDEFSQLGGHPTWLDDLTAPSGSLAKCNVCNGLMCLLLQLHGDIPQRFPDHERRLYIWACRRKACRRKEGSIRGFRAVRESKSTTDSRPESISKSTSPPSNGPKSASSGLGEALFGVKPGTSTNANPFASPSSSAGTAQLNPFATMPSHAAKPAQRPDPPSTNQNLAETFADKVKISPSISSTTSPQTKPTITPPEPWPSTSAFPEAFPTQHIDADKEYLDNNEPLNIPSNTRFDPDAMESEPSSSAAAASTENMKDVFESSMDKTFQRFADRLAQNPEQILRYEFGGHPLLYSKKDRTGKLLAQEDENAKVQTSMAKEMEVLPRVPRCGNCGAGRSFELQLTPNAIAVLEGEEMSLDGMDWGTIILAVCSKDCAALSTKVGEVGYLEEWIGVQWEEMEVRKK